MFDEFEPFRYEHDYTFYKILCVLIFLHKLKGMDASLHHAILLWQFEL